MEFKGTKGDLSVIEHSWSDTSLLCDGKVIATISIYDEATEETQEELELEVSYNFKLLSKSKEMLEALQYFVDRVENGSIKSHTTYCKYKQLIEEATKID